MSTVKAGIVVIGRNEGQRLSDSLIAAKYYGLPFVYVDSQSSDGSVEIAHNLNVDVVILDTSTLINASRGRNEGVAYLLERNPNLSYIHFIDGDTVFDPLWCKTALNILENNSEIAVVCGVLREKNRHHSLYAKLLGIEWRLMTQSNGKCGGNATIRLSALQLVNGYDETLIAGADPDLYRRLKEKNFYVKTTEIEMGEHDGGMTSFSQWWTRCKRSGYAFADARSCSKSNRGVKNTLLWGLALPISILISVFLLGPVGIIIISLYVVQIIRMVISKNIQCLKITDKIYYAVNVNLARIPQTIGVLSCYLERYAKIKKSVIHYKD
jgi:GT2 family glycosyltransferase